MAPSNATCPDICPKSGGDAKGHDKDPTQSSAKKKLPGEGIGPYEPGHIKPRKPTTYPALAPPPYLPQPTESTSGDFLQMSPVDPWAAGHIDWSPFAGCTGTRPVVDKYSITRYSTGEWRLHNQKALSPKFLDKIQGIIDKGNAQIPSTNKKLKESGEFCEKKLNERIEEIEKWKKDVEKTQRAIDREIRTLDRDREKLKGASRILMIPESISRECLELRNNRYEPDQVRDDAQQELIREVAIVGEIRKIFDITLAKVEVQMANNKAAKAAIEQDWNDKMVTLDFDKLNAKLTPDSNILQQHPGIWRWPEHSTTLDYWNHFSHESIRNCEEVRKKSEALRANLMTIILKGGQDLQTQAERTNVALKETVNWTEQVCAALEARLKVCLQKIADIEKLIDDLKEEVRFLEGKTKLCMTRLYNRNEKRPGVERCKDEPQFAFMKEFKDIKDSMEAVVQSLRLAEFTWSELLKNRGDLEKEIACKRKSLVIDKDRFHRIRSHFPSAEEFAGK